MQVETERGLIFVVEKVETEEKARELGYYFTFYSSVAKAKCFSKLIGKNSREFCLVED